MIHLLTNAGFSLLIISVATFSGLGLLQLFGLRNFKQRILLAPITALAVSGIIVAFIVILGIPVGAVSLIVWLLWILSAAYGIRYVRSALIDFNCKLVLWISILATFLVLAGFLWYGLLDYLGSPALDGWSYVSFGEYLRVYPKGVEGGLASIYQYASHLSGTRYVASAMLAVLIPPWLSGVDTQMTVGPLLILSIFSFAFSVAYAAQIANQRGIDTPAWLAVFLGVVGGWVPYALHNNNYDNLLSLSFPPVLFSLVFDRDLKGFSQILLPAVFIAASIYIYPELSPLIIVAYCIAIVEVLLSNQSEYNNKAYKHIQFLKCVWIMVIVFVIVSPYIQNVMRFFCQQLSSTMQMAGRPGEGMMPNLINPNCVWGAMWGLSSKGVGTILGVFLGLIAFLGVRVAVVKKYFSIGIYLIFIGVLFIGMITLKHYDYGAYKILLLGWWAIAIVLSAGARSIWTAVSSFNKPFKKLLRIIITTIIFTTFSIWVAQQYSWMRGYKYKTATGTRAVRDYVLRNHGAVQVSVSDVILNAWLVYQLRNAKVLFSEFRGYMDQPHVIPLMARSMVPIANEIQYLLSDIDRFTVGEIVWRSDSLKLIRCAPEQQPPEVAIYSPNGREVIGDMPFFWLGREAASIVLTTTKPKAVSFHFEAFIGPSVSALIKDYPMVSLESVGRQLFRFDTQKAATYTVRIMLSSGENTIIFRPDYNGTVVPNKNGDPRILLVGIKLLKVIVDD